MHGAVVHQLGSKHDPDLESMYVLRQRKEIKGLFGNISCLYGFLGKILVKSGRQCGWESEVYMRYFFVFAFFLLYFRPSLPP